MWFSFNTKPLSAAYLGLSLVNNLVENSLVVLLFQKLVQIHPFENDKGNETYQKRVKIEKENVIVLTESTLEQTSRALAWLVQTLDSSEPNPLLLAK